MRQGSIHARLGRRVNIDSNQILQILRTEITSPHASPAQEEALLRCKALNLTCRFLLQNILQSAISDIQATIVTDVLT